MLRREDSCHSQVVVWQRDNNKLASVIVIPVDCSCIEWFDQIHATRPVR